MKTVCSPLWVSSRSISLTSSGFSTSTWWQTINTRRFKLTVSSKHSKTYFGFYFEKPYKMLWARISEAATFWPFGRTRRRTRGRRAGRWRRNTPRWTAWTSESSSAGCRTSAAFDRETSGNLQEEDEEEEFIDRSHSQSAIHLPPSFDT